MRLDEILLEKKVESSWITDISYNRSKRILTMNLSNGKSFIIPGVSRTTFDQWTRSPSKGRYYHDRVKSLYNITRVR